MERPATHDVPNELTSELERRFSWWEPVGSQPRSDDKISAQAMSSAGFAEVRQLEQSLGYDRLVEIMLAAQPGWIDERSLGFWRGRLRRATGRNIPDARRHGLARCRTGLILESKSYRLPSKRSRLSLLPPPSCHWRQSRDAVALYLGHRTSVDLDLFKAEPLEKNRIENGFEFVRSARAIQEDENSFRCRLGT
jgi:hypothetical protein